MRDNRKKPSFTENVGTRVARFEAERLEAKKDKFSVVLRRSIAMMSFGIIAYSVGEGLGILERRETPSFTVGGIIQLVGQTLIILGCIAFTTCPVGDYDLDEAKSETKRRCLAIILLLYLVHAYFEGAPYLDVINSGFLFVGLFGGKRGVASLLAAWMVS